MSSRSYKFDEISGATEISTANEIKRIMSSIVSSIPSASDDAPLADGNASAGTSPTFSRSDHIHPIIHEVIEASDISVFPATGQSSKIYVDTKANTTYRWNGSQYVQIGGGSSGAGALIVNCEFDFQNMQIVNSSSTLEEALTALEDGIPVQIVGSYGNIQYATGWATDYDLTDHIRFCILIQTDIFSQTGQDKPYLIEAEWKYDENDNEVFPITSTQLATKSDIDNIEVRYALLTPTITYTTTSATNDTANVTLSDRAINAITPPSSGIDYVIFEFPPIISGRARDFFVRLTLLAADIPTLIFKEADDTPISFDVNDSYWAEIGQGVNLLMFTETSQEGYQS